MANKAIHPTRKLTGDKDVRGYMRIKVLSIDPGPTQSAYVIWDGEKILDKDILSNWELLDCLALYDPHSLIAKVNFAAIEFIKSSRGMPVGEPVFQTVFWIGVFVNEMGHLNFNKERKWFCHLMGRSEVKSHICGSQRARDSNIRQALIDRFGPPGTKKEPGLTYNLKKDLWQAFALAVTYYDLYLQDKS